MGENKRNNTYPKKSFSAKIMAVAVFMIMLIMGTSIFAIITLSNKVSNEVIDLTQEANEYKMDALDMMSGISVMFETSNAYIQTPVNPENPSFSNFEPLLIYVPELTADRSALKTLERFKKYRVSNEVVLLVHEATEKAEDMKKVQIHAISVMDSVHPLSNCPPQVAEILSQIPLVPLTESELAMSNEERESYAKSLVNNSDYEQIRFYISKDVNALTAMIETDFNEKIQAKVDYIKSLRIFFSFGAIFLMVVFLIVFTLFYVLILSALRKYVTAISLNNGILESSRVKEIQQVVLAYNELWTYRNKLEKVLRMKAENDSLTGLPNRYCLERDWLNFGNKGESIAVLMFDVNFLKKVNDTKGHLEGDKILCTAALCIKECFMIENLNNCYRVGGDEFIALLPGVSEENIKKRINRFKLAMVRDHISVSVGYAYSDNVGFEQLKNLIEAADLKMYEEKKIVHGLKE